MSNKKSLLIGEYPTDKDGFPLHPYEVDDRFLRGHNRCDHVNNHI